MESTVIEAAASMAAAEKADVGLHNAKPDIKNISSETISFANISAKAIKEENDPNVVDFDGPDDRFNPMNKSLAFRWLHVAFLSYLAFVTSVFPSLPPSLILITAQYIRRRLLCTRSSCATPRVQCLQY